MSQADPHRLNGAKRVISLVLSALFVVLGVVGYQQTSDLIQLLLFILIAGLAVVVVHLLFALVERILNSLDDSN